LLPFRHGGDVSRSLGSALPSAVDQHGLVRARRLRAANVVVGAFLAVEAVGVMLLGNDLSLPVTASYLQSDPVVAQRAAPSEVLFRLPITVTVATFLLLAAADHLCVAAPRVHHWYARNLEAGVNYARWIEYSVSASVMIVLIAMFVGIRDIAALVAIFGVNTAMILFGLLMERHQRPGTADWSAFWFGTVAGVAPWIAVIVYLFGGSGRPPPFVYAIIVIELLLFFSFALNMALQYRRIGRWRDYVFGESAYIALSLGAKSLLAWLIFANVLRS
jgi:hypothetical protein